MWRSVRCARDARAPRPTFEIFADGDLDSRFLTDPLASLAAPLLVAAGAGAELGVIVSRPSMLTCILATDHLPLERTPAGRPHSSAPLLLPNWNRRSIRNPQFAMFYLTS